MPSVTDQEMCVAMQALSLVSKANFVSFWKTHYFRVLLFNTVVRIKTEKYINDFRVLWNGITIWNISISGVYRIASVMRQRIIK